MSSKNLERGDVVKIVLDSGYTVTGEVKSVHWYDDAGYYIEINGSDGYHYWKEVYEPGLAYKKVGGSWQQLDPEGPYRGGASMRDLHIKHTRKKE